ncbi:MAG: stage III sporulation protein AC [Ruminococcaceae bacterium]|nr:stage III sporulation protein AC [Oscillospiraceae bacterium]
MDVSLILKIVGVGLLTGVGVQLLQKSGKDEQATFVTLAGVIAVMLVLIREIATLFRTIGSVFGL